MIVRSALIGLLLLVACGGERGPVDPNGGTPLPPLQLGTWYLHEVEGSPVPGVVLTLPPGAEVEQVRVDSARFQIQADGRLEYRSWMQRTLADGTAVYVGTLGFGSWLGGSDAYTLSYGAGAGGTLVLAPGPDGALEGEEELSSDLAGVVMDVVYRSAPPPEG